MSDGFSKKLAELMGKMDDKVMQAKLNAAIEMLKKGNTEDLAKRINKVDKDELLNKINEFDISKLKDMNININDVKSKVSEDDLNKLSNMLGDQGEEIIRKIKDIIK